MGWQLFASGGGAMEPGQGTVCRSQTSLWVNLFLVFALPIESGENSRLIFLFKWTAEEEPSGSIVQDSRLESIFFAKQVFVHHLGAQFNRNFNFATECSPKKLFTLVFWITPLPGYKQCLRDPGNPFSPHEHPGPFGHPRPHPAGAHISTLIKYFHHAYAGHLFQELKEFCGSFDAGMKGLTLSNSDQVEKLSMWDESSTFFPNLRSVLCTIPSPGRHFLSSIQRRWNFNVELQVFNPSNIQAEKDDDVFHFVSFLPIGGRIYELDGLKVCIWGLEK